jgi:hypothetical protein
MHTCTHAHMHTCTHAHMHTCTHAHMHTCTHAHIHTCTHAHIHTCTHMHTSTHAYMFETLLQAGRAQDRISEVLTTSCRHRSLEHNVFARGTTCRRGIRRRAAFPELRVVSFRVGELHRILAEGSNKSLHEPPIPPPPHPAQPNPTPPTPPHPAVHAACTCTHAHMHTCTHAQH